MWVAPELSWASSLKVISRYFDALTDEALWAAFALLFFWYARGALRRAHQRSGAGRAAMPGIIAVAVAWSLSLGWVADDAYISFRYAKNWVEGAGLVFNAGERVEGYTNFLWVVLLSPFQAAGLPLPLVSVVLTSTCLVSTLLATAALSERLSHQLGGTPGPSRHFPIAAALLGLNYTFASFGTSGLETMLGSLLVLLALERAERGAFLASGSLGILATLTHPDHAIFYVCLGVAYALPTRRLSALGRFALPFFVGYAPYFAWRWSYYGDLFPNTYYAKNAHLFYFSQGARYLALSGMSSGLWAALPLALYAMLRFRRLRIARFCALALPLFLLYVAKIGGDFMLGRLLMPLLPLVYVMAELGLRALAQEAKPQLRRWATPALALFCTAAVPVRFIKPREIYAHVADERTWYPIQSYAPFVLDNAYWHWAQTFNRAFGGLSRKPALAMFSVGIVGYETGLHLVDNAGLNHRGVAHWQNRHRGRPGHEKIIGPAMLVQSAADLADLPVYPEPYPSLARVGVDNFRFHTVKYDRRLFEELRLAGVSTPPLLRYLDEYEPAAAPERLECDLWHMREIYFRHQPDPARRQALLTKLIAARPEWAGYEDFLLATSPPSGSRWARRASLDFDAAEPGAELSGDAFLNNPVEREAAGQLPMTGVRGHFINSFQPENGDLATGTYTSEELSIEGDVITLQIGGGHFPERELVELLVDGERRFHATGCNSGILGQRLWVTRGLRGRSAQLRVVDRRRGELGHIVVDELVQWERSEPLEGDAPGKPVEVSHPHQD